MIFIIGNDDLSVIFLQKFSIIFQYFPLKYHNILLQTPLLLNLSVNPLLYRTASSILSMNNKENILCVCVCLFCNRNIKWAIFLTYVGYLTKYSGSLYKSGCRVDHKAKSKRKRLKDVIRNRCDI